jgi:hypothetical protein
VDRIAFSHEEVIDGPGRPFNGVAIRVNGSRLEDRARVVEMPHAVAEGKPCLAGDYEPLALSDIGSDRSHFLGHPVATWFEDGRHRPHGLPARRMGLLAAHSPGRSHGRDGSLARFPHRSP